MSVFFSDNEVKGLHPDLIERLTEARRLAKIPFFISSGYRSPDSNENAGGVKDSAHMRGLAVDLACHTSSLRLKIVSACIMAGFTRIGVYDRHVHVDIDGTLPQEVLWLGGASH